MNYCVLSLAFLSLSVCAAQKSDIAHPPLDKSIPSQQTSLLLDNRTDEAITLYYKTPNENIYHGILQPKKKGRIPDGASSAEALDLRVHVTSWNKQKKIAPNNTDKIKLIPAIVIRQNHKTLAVLKPDSATTSSED
jgi:hypothetical protein